MARNFLTALASGIAHGFKSVVPVTTVPASTIGAGRGWWGTVRESFSGAWQAGVTVDSTEAVLAFGPVYACISLIAGDISKMRPKLVQLEKGVWNEVDVPAFSPVLRKPNHYQTRMQFLSTWVVSKLIHGNTYVLKERDARNIVVGLHVLNASMVKAMVANNGDVFYSLSYNLLANIQSVIVPASEIIHDRGVCLFHPLVGVPPIFACAISATQGNKIQANSAKFFENMSRPSGQLTAEGTISDETAARLKAEFEKNFSGGNLGRLLVTGDGLKYEAMGVPAQQAQLTEQLGWTVQDIARVFHVPLHKIASDTGIKFNNMAAMNQDYYSQCLQELIESIEVLLDEGLGLTGGPQTLGVELDLDGLLRMDLDQLSTTVERLVKAGVMAPNEGRQRFDLMPVKGGEMPFLQQQNFSLEALSKQPAPGSMPPAPKPEPVVPQLPPPEPNLPAKAMEAFMERVQKQLDAMTQEQIRQAERDAAAELRRGEEQAAAERRDAEVLAAAQAESDAQQQVKSFADKLIARFTLAAAEH